MTHPGELDLLQSSAGEGGLAGHAERKRAQGGDEAGPFGGQDQPHVMLKAAVAATSPAEVGILMRALAECLQAATAVLTEPTQPTANPGK